MKDIKFELTREEAQTLKSLLVDYFMMKENSDGDMFAGKRMKLTGDFIKKINDFEKQFPLITIGIVEWET